jgi:hypothetical protein
LLVGDRTNTTYLQQQSQVRGGKGLAPLTKMTGHRPKSRIEPEAVRSTAATELKAVNAGAMPAVTVHRSSGGSLLILGL